MGSTVFKYLGSNQNTRNNQSWTGLFGNGNFSRALNIKNVFTGHKKSNPKAYFKSTELEPSPDSYQAVAYNFNTISDPAAKEIVGVIYLEIQKILFSKIQPSQKGVKLYQLIKNLLKAISLLRILPANQALINSLRGFLPNSLFDVISVHQINFRTSYKIVNALNEIITNLPKKLDNINLGALKTQIEQFQNLNQALENNQTSFVPGVLATGICKIIAFSLSSSRVRASIISSDEKMVIFLENLMTSCAGDLNNVNPLLENSFVYYNCSELVRATFKRYPILNPKISSIIFENIAQNLFLHTLSPALQSQVSAQEMTTIQKRYGQVLLHFKTKMSERSTALPESNMLEKLRKMLPA